MIALVYMLGGVFLMVVVGYFLSAPGYKGPVSDHFDGKRFTNPTGVKAKGFPDLVKWMTSRKRGKWRDRRDVPFGDRPVPRVEKGLRITYVNHTTFLIQVDGLNLLTDPVWSMRVSPFSIAGPKRRRPPGIRFEDLPPIDLVLLSHNHYDHLDINTLSKIHVAFNPKFIVPLGVGEFLKRNGMYDFHELDWWESIPIGASLNIDAVPAQHFSGRGMFDRDATLWCGYVIRRKDGNIYFAGDTGYNVETFKSIGKRYAPVQLATIPIGAYKPEWFMAPIHCSPHEAVKIHLDVKPLESIATHFGTFPLADDSETDPATDLRKAVLEHRMELDSFRILIEGEAHNF